MIKLKGSRESMILVGAGTDVVMFAFDLPAESVLQKIKAKIHMVTSSVVATERENAVAYSAAMYILPHDDPDAVTDYQALWDIRVPKYTDVDTIDLDGLGSDATPFWEPGEADLETLFHMGRTPHRLFSRVKRMNFSSPGSGGIRFQPSETPFEAQWLPGDTFNIRTNKRIRISQPSCVIVAIGSPNYDDTTTTMLGLVENQWGQIQYAEATLERMMIDQMNLVETGAETPYEDASIAFRAHLAPNVFEQTGASFVTHTWHVFGTLEFEHTVPGHISFKTVDLTPLT